MKMTVMILLIKEKALRKPHLSGLVTFKSVSTISQHFITSIEIPIALFTLLKENDPESIALHMPDVQIT